MLHPLLRSILATAALDAQVNYGESVKLVGSSPELGDWDVDRAPELSWTEGDVWTTSVELAPGSDVHFKVLGLHISNSGCLHTKATTAPSMKRVLIASPVPWGAVRDRSRRRNGLGELPRPQSAGANSSMQCFIVMSGSISTSSMDTSDYVHPLSSRIVVAPSSKRWQAEY